MKHAFVKKNLSAYLDDELPQSRMQEIAFHLKSCESCRKEVEEIREGKTATAYFEQPDWPGTERLWENIQRRKSWTTEKIKVRSVTTKRSDLFQRLIHPKPSLALLVFAILFMANWLINIKSEKFQYQLASIDWTPSYAFDYGLYLDALIEDESPREFDQRYESKRASYEHVGSQIPFRLASFTRMPDTFQLQEVRLLKNACCRSVQFRCLKNTKAITIFQQPKGHPVAFGKYPLQSLQINGQLCHKVQAGSWTALSWEGQDSQLVAIGEMNEADMAAIMTAVMPL